MNEKYKKPTHYTTGENGEAVPVYPETAEKTSETVEPKRDSAPLYYVTEPSGEVKPVGVNTEIENETQKENEPEKLSFNDVTEMVDMAENTAEEITDTSETTEAEEKIYLESQELNQPEEEAVVNTEVIEDSTKDAAAEEIELSRTETESAINEVEAEEKQTTAAEIDNNSQGKESESNIENSSIENIDKPTEEDLQKVDLKLDYSQEESKQEQQEVEAASKLINEPVKEKGKKKKGLAAALAGALAVVGIGVGYASTKGSESTETTKSPSSTSAEETPGTVAEQEQQQNVLSGITIEKTVKEFDNEQYQNVFSLSEAKNFCNDPTDTPATETAIEADPNDSPIVDYNVKIFGIMLNGNADEVRSILQQLGLGPQELKELYDRAIKLGTYNEWAKIEKKPGPREGWPIGQGAYTPNVDNLDHSIYYNRVFAVAIASAIETTGGNIPPAQPRSEEALQENREVLTEWLGPVSSNTLYVDTDGSVKASIDPVKITAPPENIVTSYDDLATYYIDPNDPELKLVIGQKVDYSNLKNLSYNNLSSLPAYIGFVGSYPWKGPTFLFENVSND
jgi:hypothetical protein